MQRPPAAAALLLLFCCAASAVTAQPQPVIPQTARYGSGARPGSSAATPAKYTLDVTAATRAPDCFTRRVIMVNGEFMPTLELTQGDFVEITVKNNIPTDWPAITEGITIHWHGFSMHGYPFMDGTLYVSQCPIAPGTSFTYKFQVNEMPGSYFYHSHSALYRADGLQGALIVRERPGTAALNAADGESTLMLADWWHFPGNSLAMRLNRPFDPSKVGNSSGAWCWVGVPKAILINGRGNYFDCEDVYKRQVGSALPFRSDKQAAAKDVMAPNACIAGQLGAAAEQPMCSVTEGASGPGAACAKQRAEVVVTPGKTHRVRLINAGMLVYMTVCFEKHTVTVVALDAAPVMPRAFKECVDVNTGQRVDVIIKADQPAGSYWISVGSQYRKGAPSGFGVLRYKGSSQAPEPANIMQPGTAVDKKWTSAETMGFTAPSELLNPATASSASAKAAVASYLAPAVPGQPSWRLPKKDVDKRFIIQATQPLLEENGILRWALNSVAHSDAPPCRSVIQDVRDNPRWAADNAMSAANAREARGSYFTQTGGSAATWKGDGSRLKVVDASSANSNLLNDLKKPGPGTHVLTIDGSKPVVELVIQNDRAGLYGGEYVASKNASLTNARNGREQHSFHLHGYHFWLVGMGMGEWDPSKVSEYNLRDPVLRDTATVMFNGTTEDRAAWVAFRFVADNPGVFPMHCHIAWHQIMGQGLNVIVDPGAISKMPLPELPSCPKPCFYDFAQTNPKAVAAVYGDSSSTKASVASVGGSNEAGSRVGPGMVPPEDANLP